VAIEQDLTVQTTCSENFRYHRCIQSAKKLIFCPTEKTCAKAIMYTLPWLLLRSNLLHIHWIVFWDYHIENCLRNSVIYAWSLLPGLSGPQNISSIKKFGKFCLFYRTYGWCCVYIFNDVWMITQMYVTMDWAPQIDLHIVAVRRVYSTFISEFSVEASWKLNQNCETDNGDRI
jgi:hypothetical protein